MTELGQDRVEHDAAERIVLDAEDAQRLRRRRRPFHGAQAGRVLRLGAGQRHRQREGGSAAAPLRHGDVAPHRARDLFHRGQSEPGAAEARGDRDIGLRERTEQPLDLVEREPDPAVGNRKGDADLALAAAHRLDRQRDAARIGELHRIVDQVFQRSPQPHRIADHHRRQLLRNLDMGLQAFGRRPAGERIAGIARQRPQIEEILPHPGAAASGGIDEQRRQAGEMFRAGLDGIDPAALALVEVRRRQEIADGKNSGERGADLVRKRRQRRLDHAGRGRLGGAFGHPGRGNGWSAFLQRPALRWPSRAR